jgi:hypothetical protein
MKMKMKISILVSGDATVIEVHDENASCIFAKIEMTPEQFCSALGRLARVDCKGDIYNLKKIGKKMEMKTIEFKMPKNCYTRQKEIAIETAKKHTPKGWTADTNYGSQNSFFTKNNKEYAQTTIRRWI